LTDAQTAMGLSTDDSAENLRQLIRLSDVFVRANTSANTSVQQVAEALTSDAGSAAKNYGAELETTVAILDAYASAGKKGAEAGNLFGRMTRLLTKAQRENGEVFDKYGIDVIDKSTGEYINLIDVIADMENAFSGMTKPVRDAALAQLGFEALAQKSITPLIGLSDAMRDYEEQLLTATGATNEVATKQMQSFSAQLKITWNQISGVADSIGNTLAPMILSLNNGLRSGIAWWNKISESQQKFIVYAGLIAAATGPVLIILGKLLGFAGGMIGRLTSVGRVAARSALMIMRPVGALAKLVSASGKQVHRMAGMTVTSLDTITTGAVRTGSRVASAMMRGTATATKAVQRFGADVGFEYRKMSLVTTTTSTTMIRHAGAPFKAVKLLAPAALASVVLFSTQGQAALRVFGVEGAQHWLCAIGVSCGVSYQYSICGYGTWVERFCVGSSTVEYHKHCRRRSYSCGMEWCWSECA
jgi:TP901 family phage tail tape measure protein